MRKQKRGGKMIPIEEMYPAIKDIFGIDGNDVVSLTLKLEAGCLATVVIERVVQQEETSKLKALLAKCKLIPAKPRTKKEQFILEVKQ